NFAPTRVRRTPTTTASTMDANTSSAPIRGAPILTAMVKSTETRTSTATANVNVTSTNGDPIEVGGTVMAGRGPATASIQWATGVTVGHKARDKATGAAMAVRRTTCRLQVSSPILLVSVQTLAMNTKAGLATVARPTREVAKAPNNRV